MAMKNLLTLARNSHRRSSASFSHAIRSASTSPAVAASSPPPSPPPPNAMIYDRLAEAVKSKLKQLENPDPRFLKYGSPHPTITDHTRILSAPETRVTTLPNGLRVATESNLAARTATVGVWIDAGSRFETEETNGTAHFLEHMIFKGTEKRTARQLEEEIENMGGHLNAYTSREQTTYYAKVLDKDVPKALDILADILQNSKFDEHRISRERDVILREMEEVEGQTEEVIFDHLHATAFQYTPLGRTILGPAQNIRTITKDHLQSYIQTHYTAPRMVIAASGAVKHEDFVEQVKKLFTKLSSEPTTASQLVAKEPAIFTGSEVRIIDDDVPLAQFAIAFNGASWTDPDSIALMVMQAMLGSWNKSAGGGKHMGSELAQRVAINEVAESMMAFNTNYKDTGLFGVYAVAKPDCLDDLAYAIMYETTKLAYRVSEPDVTRARNQLKSSLLLHIDGTSPVAEDIGRQLLTYGRRIPFAELFARIDAVDASTIKRVANRFIYDRVRTEEEKKRCCNCCFRPHPGFARLQLVQTQDILEPLLDDVDYSCYFWSHSASQNNFSLCKITCPFGEFSGGLIIFVCQFL
ncbi:probable mitochondrial-processing peptidase subunit beta, mitochondrial isoform X2 [Momordica charantia]|uniref:mitochondrial processing peptidase n=1 Tax=Momordica charantia TaxID=3673 RepID=A0A6J1CSB3_MOMCH|nr:probable mitochondrial-processing peptidase subunit beta, mitochondrial isoform X2 [Momordica charantia]